ncbi:MAG: VOC family protein [Chloroflexi bacterium]|nr:VOC family protein [Chloroflexota bacterium]
MTNDQPADVRLGPLLQVSMPVVDIDRAVAFYRDVLGAHFFFQAGTLGFFDLDGVRLMLAVPEGSGGEGGSVLYFRVPDVPAAHATLLARGVAFEGDPHVVHRDDRHELWMAFFRDSEGNLLALSGERPLG